MLQDISTQNRQTDTSTSHLSTMHVPSSTYRIQLHRDFTFKDLHHVISYLHSLGITTIYAAPVLQSAAGSIHGYDTINSDVINPEIGTLQELKIISGLLSERGMFWLQDIVPNHMAFHPGNKKLMDVLERGPASPYYNYFDIDWNHAATELRGKLMIPFLGEPLKTSLEKGDVKLSFIEEGIVVRYFDTQYPLSIVAFDVLQEVLHPDQTALLKPIFEDLRIVAQAASSFEAWTKYKAEKIRTLSDAERYQLQELVRMINNTPGKLERVLSHQYYILMAWKETEHTINYRRFFTVNSLICLKMEDVSVFEEYHTFIKSLFEKGIVHGFRIDHIDGLNDPSQYVRMLRRLTGDRCYIIAEKILEAREEVPEQWPLQGTSGYEFLSYTNQLFTNRKGAKQLLQFYRTLIPEMPEYAEMVFENKKLILEKYMAGEWENLVSLFFHLNLQHEFERTRIKQALALMMLSLPVYRVYPERLPIQGRSLEVIRDTFKKARQRDNDYDPELNYLEELLTTYPGHAENEQRILTFFKRMMQFTGPLTAKGVEDTTFYNYNPLISHDEVGDTPATLGISVQEFHRQMEIRQRTTPLSLNATATHDTKRGEDARMRLNVLSEFPEAWQSHVDYWMTLHQSLKVEIDGMQAPTVNDEYFIYQSIVGGFPEDYIVSNSLIERLEQYIIKAVREAKTNSCWENPNEAYESACINFMKKILSTGSDFVADLTPFMIKVCDVATIYSLAQTLIKITAPGIPDTYQGCELWDLSYVDPDNRRPVDYEYRNICLNKIKQMEPFGKEIFFSFLKSHRHQGLEKLFITWRVLNFRRKNPDLFVKGRYLPLAISENENTALAYTRHFGDQWIIVVVPLGLGTDERKHDARIQLPEDAPGVWINILTGEILTNKNALYVSQVLKSFPVALLSNKNSL